MPKIMIVGEAFGEQEERAGEAFVGPSGQVLNGLLHQVGIERRHCAVTNVFNLRPPGNDVKNLCGPKATAIPNFRALVQSKYVRAEFQPELDRLFAEVERADPNIIIACGNTPLWALCKKSGIKKYRGAPIESYPLPSGKKYKVIPTWHPAAVLRQWELRAIALADFSKAKREAEFPELKRPSHKIYLDPSLEDIKDFYHEFLVGQPFLSCDIETKLQTITEVGYALPDGSRAIVIPFWKRSAPDGNYWRTFEEEREAWDWVRRINSEFPLIGQNFSYDMQYFWRTVRIPSPKFIGDTMILHHSLQPELEKGLGFLASIYTNEPSWKFMRTDHDTLKREDD